MRRCVEAAALALALAGCSPKSPATQVKEMLARAAPLRVSASGADADVERLRFSDVVVSMDGSRALVLGMAEAEGRVRAGGEPADLAYVGREAFAMERCPGAGWCAEGGLLPGVRAVLAALPSLADALGRDAGGPVRVVAWQVRVERGVASVGADYELAAGGPAPRRLRARWELVREGDAFALPAAR